MRITSFLVVLSLTGCASLPGFDQPRISTSPQVVLLKVDYNTSMQSQQGGVLVNNPSQNQDSFNSDDLSTQVGGKIRIGDGFSGLEFSYLHIDVTTASNGNLTANWGVLRSGDLVNTEIKGNEYRLRYIAQFFDHSFETDYDDIRVQVGAGPGFAHRDLELKASDFFRVRTQKAKPKDDGVLYLASRAKVSYSDFSAWADFQVSPDANFGGDFEGALWDLELLGMYEFEDQDLKVFAGWRRSKLDSSGTQDGYAYNLDWTLEGWVMGFEFTF